LRIFCPVFFFLFDDLRDQFASIHLKRDTLWYQSLNARA
jgi:hypothetical protein